MTCAEKPPPCADTKGLLPASSSALGVGTAMVLGTPIALVDQGSLLIALAGWLDRRMPDTGGVYVVFRDVHGVVRALDDPALAAAHRAAFMNVPDGGPLAFLCRLRGHEAGRTPGADILSAVCKAGLSQGWRHAFFGSTPAVLAALTERLARAHPGLNIVDAISPPFRLLRDEESDVQIARLAHARPDFVWVGLGCPKQEIWMARYAHRIPGAIAMGVGAAFDFHAGTVKRAPAAMRRAGLEWLHRALQDPGRLGRRYLHAVPRFMAAIVLEEARHRLGIRRIDGEP